MTFGVLFNPNYEGNKALDAIKDLVLGFGFDRHICYATGDRKR